MDHCYWSNRTQDCQDHQSCEGYSLMGTTLDFIPSPIMCIYDGKTRFSLSIGTHLLFFRLFFPPSYVSPFLPSLSLPFYLTINTLFFSPLFFPLSLLPPSLHCSLSLLLSLPLSSSLSLPPSLFLPLSSSLSPSLSNCSYQSYPPDPPAHLTAGVSITLHTTEPVEDLSLLKLLPPHIRNSIVQVYTDIQTCIYITLYLLN